MTQAEFAALAERWPSVISLANDLGISRNAVYRYLRGERPVPEQTARLIRILYRNPASKEFML